MERPRTAASGCGAVGCGLLIAAVGIVLTIVTGGLGAPIGILAIVAAGAYLSAAGAGTLAEKAAETPPGKAIVKTAVAAGKEARVFGTEAAGFVRTGAITARKSRILTQLHDQLEAGAISFEEYELRVRSVLIKADLDLAGLEEEIRIRSAHVRRDGRQD